MPRLTEEPGDEDFDVDAALESRLTTILDNCELADDLCDEAFVIAFQALPPS